MGAKTRKGYSFYRLLLDYFKVLLNDYDPRAKVLFVCLFVSLFVVFFLIFKCYQLCVVLITMGPYGRVDCKRLLLPCYKPCSVLQAGLHLLKRYKDINFYFDYTTPCEHILMLHAA